jgi:succinate dehydrogenase hydrophobic anchor subunit
MKSKTTLMVKIATVAVIILSVTIIGLLFTINDLSSDGVLKNDLADIVMLVCLSLFVWILVLRDTPARNKDRYQIN